MKQATTQGFLQRSLIVENSRRTLRCGADDVLVKVYASSVNPKDWKLNQNFSALAPTLGGRRPAIIGDDLAGVVLERGSKVRDFAVGDEVYGMDMNWRTAACAERAIISQRRIAHKPAGISFTKAAGVPLAGLTALQALRIGGVTAGSHVLIIGASGGVGCFAVQIAKAQGATVTAVCSYRNTEFVAELGVDHTIDYCKTDYRQGPAEFDCIFDATSFETPASCASRLEDNGIFVSTGGHAKALLGWAAAQLVPGAPNAKMVKVDANTADLRTLASLIERGAMQVVIDSEFSLENINTAYERGKTGRARGKIIVHCQR